MPTYELTSPKSGKTYKVEFASEPGESDIDDAIAHFDGQPAASTPGALEQARLKAKAAATTGKPVGGIAGDIAAYARPAVPFVGAVDAAKEGYASGRQLLGDNVLGSAAGLGLGAVNAIGTAFNPIAVGGQYVSRLAQAGGQALGGDTAGARETLAGEGEVLPGVQPLASESTAANFASDLYSQVRKDPINTALVAEGAATMGGRLAALRAARLGRPLPSWVKSVYPDAASEFKAQLLKPDTAVVQARERFVDALDPRARAMDPTKQVKAQQRARESVALVLNDIPEMKAHGAKFATAGDTLDAAMVAKRNIFKQRAEMVGGAAEPIRGDAIAAAIDSVVNDPVNLLRHGPDAMAALKAEAERYRGQALTPEIAEQLNQHFNAGAEVKRAAIRGVDDAKLRKNDPSYAADLEASAALKAELARVLGGEFSELGRKYGAWSEIAQHAERQKAKQFILENRDSLPRTLALIKSAGSLVRGDVGEALATGAMGEYMRYRGTPDAKFSRLDSALSSYAKWKASQPPRPTTPGLAMAARAQAVPPRPPPPEPPAAPPMPPPVEPPPVPTPVPPAVMPVPEQAPITAPKAYSAAMKKPAFKAAKWIATEGPGGEWMVSNGKHTFTVPAGEKLAKKTAMSLNSQKADVDAKGFLKRPSK